MPASLIEAANAELGAVDILVANAGAGTKTAWCDVILDLWNTTFAINATRTVPAGTARFIGDDRAGVWRNPVHLVGRHS